MAQKIKKMEEVLSIVGEAAKVISYADYFAHRPLFSTLQIQNQGEETVEGLRLSVQNANGMLLPCEKEVDVPFESAVEVDLGSILSPLYFSNIMVKWYYYSRIFYPIWGNRTTPLPLYGIKTNNIAGKIKRVGMASKTRSV